MKNKTNLRRSKSPPISFHYGFRSFIGYLEGSGKSGLTVKNYRLDLLSFEKFLQKTSLSLEKLKPSDLEYYHSHLKEKGLKTNTRRRKLLTVRRFLQYLNRRKKLSMDVGNRFATPYKVERVPFTVSTSELIQKIRELPSQTVLEARNRVLLWSLAETGCLVSEICRLKFTQWRKSQASSPALVHFHGRNRDQESRDVPVSFELFEAVMELSKNSKSEWIFLGFNKFGSMGSAISPRGVELLLKHFAGKLGFPQLTPRTVRHSAVIHWNGLKVPRLEIQKRLGLKTDYAFRSYEPLLSEPKSRT